MPPSVQNAHRLAKGVGVLHAIKDLGRTKGESTQAICPHKPRPNGPRKSNQKRGKHQARQKSASETGLCIPLRSKRPKCYTLLNVRIRTCHERAVQCPPSPTEFQRRRRAKHSPFQAPSATVTNNSAQRNTKRVLCCFCSDTTLTA